jgi:two-component system, NarL family, nitrate/nitrite response regulator NarL
MGSSALVVDGNGSARRSMCHAIRLGCGHVDRIVEAGTVRQARQAIETLGVGSRRSADGAVAADAAIFLLLIDPDLPDGDGRELLSAVSTNDLNGVVASHRCDDASLEDALKRGATGYLLKEDPAEVWADALGGLSHGRPALSPAVARRLMTTFAQRERRHPGPQARASEVLAIAEGEIRRLSPRESEVLIYLSKGMTIREISTLLGIRWFTVNDHIKSIYRKLDVSSRAEAAVLATRLGLV